MRIRSLIKIQIAVSILLFTSYGFAETCKAPKINFKKISKSLEELKKDQIFIFPEARYQSVKLKEEKPEFDTYIVHELFDEIQKETFGTKLISLRSSGGFNFESQIRDKTVFFDKKLVEEILNNEIYKNNESLLAFVLAHEISHFAQNFIALKNNSHVTIGGLLFVSDALTFGLNQKLINEVDKKIGKNSSEEKREEYLKKLYDDVHTETDAYAYAILRKMDFELPNNNDLKILLNKVTNNREAKQINCATNQRVDLLNKFIEL